jgi:hypothetical protein
VAGRTVLLCLLAGAFGCVDGGPHPEPPDPLGPPGGQVDSGVDVDNPTDEGVGMEGPPGGAAAGGTGGAGGAAGDESPTECMDAGVEGGWDDEDSGALRSRSR